MKKWKKPIIKDDKLTKYNYIVQYSKKLKLGKNFDIGTFTYINSYYGVEIGDNVQIGSHCSIMPNVTIGEGAVIAAYSFVTNNVPTNEIWAGVPAKFMKKI